MVKKNKVLLIIPAFNEEGIIGPTLDNIISLNLPIDILVVNDGSNDDTLAEIEKRPSVKVLSFPFNLGIGAAGHLGHRYALENGYDYAIRFDADGQHNAPDIKKMMELLQQYDVVQATRFFPGSEYTMSFTRKISIIFFSKLMTFLSKTKITDATNGFRGVNLKGIKQFVDYYPTEYLGDTVAAVAAAANGLKFTEFPSKLNQRQHGQPTQSLPKLVIHMLRTVVVMFVILTWIFKRKKR